jgi:hypothetical protein
MKKLLFILLILSACSDDEKVDPKNPDSIVDFKAPFTGDALAFINDAAFHGHPVNVENIIVESMPAGVSDEYAISFTKNGQRYVQVKTTVPSQCWRPYVYREMAKIMMGKVNDCDAPDYDNMQNIMCEDYQVDCLYKSGGDRWNAEIMYLFTGSI